MERITINPSICQGKPTIRNMRFTVVQMLELLASGMTAQEILDDYTYYRNGGYFGVFAVCCKNGIISILYIIAFILPQALTEIIIDKQKIVTY
jgi:hypothetical protein